VSVIHQLLTHNGVAAERMIATGSSDTVPIASNATEEGRAANRRVEVRVDIPLGPNE
jgi:outer membrane protein OmpA-like peptidoglycan-associated protein